MNEIMRYGIYICYLLFGMVEGERRPGRPARRWIDDILKWCDKDLRDAASMTEDRTKLESALCGDANPRRLQRQSCCG